VRGAEHVVARARAPRLARPATGPLQATGPQLHDQVVDMSAGQVLGGELPKFAADGLQNVFVARGRGSSDLVAGTQPICARLLNRDARRLHIRARIDLALDLRKRSPGLLFGPVPPPQLLTLAIDDPGVGGQLIADDRLAPGAVSKLDASNLWWQLAALSHLREVLRRSFRMRSDEAVDLGRGNAARRPDLYPCQLAGFEESVDR
jgi:hypothetical protein